MYIAIILLKQEHVRHIQDWNWRRRSGSLGKGNPSPFTISKLAIILVDRYFFRVTFTTDQ